MVIKPRDLFKMIDYTFLSPTASVKDVKKLCQRAIEYKFASVCINPIFVPMCFKLLKGSSIKVATVIAYPLGASTTESKAFQARQAIKEGCQELEIVMNLSALKSEADDLVKADIKAVVDATRVSPLGSGALVKVVIETAHLSSEEITKACRLAVDAGADFIQTSTGFGNLKSEIETISSIRKIVGREIGVKAAGTYQRFEDIVSLIDAGANRVGTDVDFLLADTVKD